MERPLAALIVVACVGPLTSASARADDSRAPISLVSTSSDMASLMADLEEMRAELDRLKASHAVDTKHVFDGYNCCYPCGWFVGAEAVIVQPHFGNGIYKAPGVPAGADFDYYVTPRIVVGLRGAQGLALRARYWYFDQSTGPVAYASGGITGLLIQDLSSQQTITVSSGLRVEALDLEASKVCCLCGVQWDLSAGLRYGKVESSTSYGLRLEDEGQLLELGSVFDTDFEGIGPTLALQGRHTIGSTRLAVVGNLRASVLFGDQKRGERYTFGSNDGGVLVDATLARFDDKLVPVLESQVGLEWTAGIGTGCLALRCLLEGQWWGNAVLQETTVVATGLSGPAYPDVEDVGFFGGTVSAAYTW